ncbi:MAG: sglT 7 [Acidobacteria bacterium]|jgi:SSS family solute:Na+ symporter|nr:sglT 7 [Acidobacteriota bacterium]
MQLSVLDQVIVVVYLAAIMGIGFAMKRRSAKGMSSYFLGGRQLPWWALAMSGSSSYFDITGTMWIVSTFIALGLKGMWVHMLWGFPITAFYLAYMGKWIRRSDAMTGAEWMKTRFGAGKAGDIARLSYTLFAVLTIAALLGYGAIGMGKFGAIFLPFSPNVCAFLILGITGVYVVAGGFHGIVRVEIVQTIVLSAGAIAFAVIGYMHFDPAVFNSKIPAGWHDIMPQIRPEAFQDLVTGGTDYSFFGALVAVWVAKGLLLCLSGPEQLYDFQRFLAAKDERDASKLGALWGAIHTVRWCFAMAIAVMAIMGIGDAVLDAKLKADPETALPLIIGSMLPVGLVGFMLAALLSGFLATFSSTVNGGAAYLVKDVYQRYINPNADAKRLVHISYLSSALLIIVGLIISIFGTSINTAFLWIFGTLAAGILPPNVLRWYWWRLNGQGYAAGVFGGMALSLGQVFLEQTGIIEPLPLYVGFPVIAVASTAITIVVALLTEPTDIETLKNFYRKVQPAGAWQPARSAVLAETPDFKKQSPFARDAFNTVVALIGITALYVSMLYLVLHRLEIGFTLLGTTLITIVILYFTWYKHLPPPAPTPSEDAENMEEQMDEISHGKTLQETL